MALAPTVPPQPLIVQWRGDPYGTKQQTDVKTPIDRPRSTMYNAWWIVSFLDRAVVLFRGRSKVSATVMVSAKGLLKRALGLLARSDRACAALLPTLREVERQVRAKDRVFIEAAIRRAFPELTVRHGPFAGLVYPSAASFGSVLFPKVLGSYERELHEAMEESVQKRPTAIVNIGCAEGYYAVGLALRVPEVQVFAFETDPQARDACLRMAQANRVQERLQVSEHCTADALIKLPLGDRALIIADCEGDERWLFTADAAEALRHHDLIIEIARLRVCRYR